MRLPPLESLRVFEAAARHGGFAKAAEELCVTPAAVAHRVKMLERHLGLNLFTRHHRGVRLNREGAEYLAKVQRLLGEVHEVTEQLATRGRGRRLKIVCIEVFAEKWLMPRLSDFTEAHPDIVISLHTEHRDIDPVRQDVDVWITYSDEVAAGLVCEPLITEHLLAVCSPALLLKKGVPDTPDELLSWPLLYDSIWVDDWAHWFTHHGVPPPDLSLASGFRLYSMLVQAAVTGIGAAVGHVTMIAGELESGQLVALFQEPVAAPSRYLLVTTAISREKSEVKVFRNWIARQARESQNRSRDA